MTITAVIPARNEAKHIRSVIERTLPFVDYVILVDDGSTDDTVAIAQSISSPKVVAIKHSINLGKGAALLTGCDAAVRLKTDIIVCLDADGQHNPESIPEFTNTMTNQQVDIVFGMRKFNHAMPMMMLLGNRVLSTFINWFFRVLVHDTQSGYRAFTADAFQKMRWESGGYEAETEMIVRASEQKLKYAEIEIDTIYHDTYKGTTALDGVRIFLYILRWKFI